MKFKEELQQLNRKVYYYTCLGSTNDEARLLADQGADSGSLVVAECQSAGKGRMGRAFFSPSGDGIWMSLILRPDILPQKASMLTLIAAVAVHDTLTEFGIDSGIKWPNDVVVQGKKITGILTEMKAVPDLVDYVILGVGMNVNMTTFPKDIEAVATSMTLVSGKSFERGKIVESFLRHFEADYQTFLNTGHLGFMKQRYNEHLIHMNKNIHIHEICREWQGVSQGINDMGELLVKTDDGNHWLRSGEVSIRGVYGYIE